MISREFGISVYEMNISGRTVLARSALVGATERERLASRRDSPTRCGAFTP